MAALTIGFDGTALFRKTDGIGRYTYSLLEAYLKKYPHHTVILIGFSNDSPAHCDLFKRYKNLRLYKLPFPRKPYQTLYNHLFRFPVDHFIPKLDVFVGTNFVRYPFIKHVPSLTVIHDLAYLRYPEVIEQRNLHFLQKHVPKTVAEGVVLASSSFTATELQKEFHLPTPCFVVSNGIDTERFTQRQSSERENYILTVGTLEPRKNLERLIKAYVSLPASVKNAHPLIVVGNGGWGGQAPKQAPTIRYTGYVDDESLVRLYQKAKLFVFPSIYEGFGLPLLEALAAGTPTLASDIPPFRSIGKEYISYFDPFSTEDIAHTLEHALQNTKSPKNQSVPKEYLQSYSWNNSAEQLHTAITNVLLRK